MTAYYNENDPKAAAWLRELIAAGLIAAGEVDERSIEDVRPIDLAGFRQCHFFAGIGGWSYALRIAGWPDDRPVWTGSCPCQPFSTAGAGKGTNDERHLWPYWRWLVDQCRPSIIFGEQVPSPLGRRWLSGVRTDLEALGYGVGAADLCAAGIGAPHIRQRLYWLADSRCIEPRQGRITGSEEGTRREPRPRSRMGRADGGMGDTSSQRARRDAGTVSKEEGEAPLRPVRDGLEPASTVGGLPDPMRSGQPRPGRILRPGNTEASKDRKEHRTVDAGRGDWDGIYVPCGDGKARRIKPGLEPLAYGVSGRVGLLRGYGNAIVPQVAATFIVASIGDRDELGS